MAEPFEVGASLTFSGRTFSLEELQLIEQGLRVPEWVILA